MPRTKSAKRKLQLDCTYEKNPASGFRTSHRVLCYCCDENAEGHIKVVYKWCGNACRRHLNVLAAKHRGAVVEYELGGIGIEEERDRALEKVPETRPQKQGSRRSSLKSSAKAARRST